MSPVDRMQLGREMPEWARQQLASAAQATPYGATSDELWAAIARAYANGQPGRYTSVDISSGVPVVGQLVQLQLEPPYAIPWRVTLAGQRVAPDQGPLVAGTPPDNQVNVNQGAQAFITWGNSIDESALIDWPWGGCTFVVHGRQCNVSMANAPALYTATNIKATFGAFATPAMGHAGGGPVERSGPRLTTPETAVAVGGFERIAVPRRAVGYRLISTLGPSVTGVSPSTGYNAATQQEDFLGTVVQFDYDGAFGLGDICSPSAASRWWPLHPACEMVRVTPNAGNAAGTSIVALQFMLDLG